MSTRLNATDALPAESTLEEGIELADDERYRLISIDAVRAPEGCKGSDWHIYRILQGDNAITGYRRGDLAGVKADVETIVSALNGRRQWTKSKAPSRAQRRG
jgi:hypothetical protein